MMEKHTSRARHGAGRQKLDTKEAFKKNLAVAALVGVTASVTLGAFAGTYYIDNGDIVVDGNSISYYDDENNQQTGEDDKITITQHDSETPTNNTITIKADEDETVTVTIEDINIDASIDGGTSIQDYEAAISVQGDGDVILELDGDNKIKGGSAHAALEKNDGSGNGTLTIKDQDDNGSLLATGGRASAGIGGSYWNSQTEQYDGNTSNITIDGGTIVAKGGSAGAGIGGGEKGNATNIVINGGTVDAQGRGGAGIGGGNKGSATVTINGGTIHAEEVGGGGAGIGSGAGGSSKDATATVTITGGKVTAKAKTEEADDIGSGKNQKAEPTINWTGGAIIKPNGSDKCQHDWANGTVELVGADTCVDTGEKHTTCPLCGSIRKELQPYEHAWDAGVETETGDTLYTCTVCGTTRTESAPEPEASAPAALDVTNLYSAAQPYDKTVENARVIFAAPAENAVLTGSLAAAAELKAQGADTIVFRTPLKETALSMDWLLAKGTDDDVFALTHKGTEASLTVEGRMVRL